MQLQELLLTVLWSLLLVTLKRASAKSLLPIHKSSIDSAHHSSSQSGSVGDHPRIQELRARIKERHLAILEDMDGSLVMQNNSGLNKISLKAKRSIMDLQEDEEIVKKYHHFNDIKAMHRKRGHYTFNVKKRFSSYIGSGSIHSAVLVLYKKMKLFPGTIDKKNIADNAVVSVYKPINKTAHMLVTSQVVSLNSEGYVYFDVTKAVNLIDSRIKLKLSPEVRSVLRFETEDADLYPQLRVVVNHRIKRVHQPRSNGCQRKYKEVSPMDFNNNYDTVFEDKVKIYYCEGTCTDDDAEPSNKFAMIVKNLRGKTPSIPVESKCVPTGFAPLMLNVKKDRLWQEVVLENAIVTDCSCM